MISLVGSSCMTEIGSCSSPIRVSMQQFVIQYGSLGGTSNNVILRSTATTTTRRNRTRILPTTILATTSISTSVTTASSRTSTNPSTLQLASSSSSSSLSLSLLGFVSLSSSSSFQKRYFMDVNTRPSHSGMFPPRTAATPSQEATTTKTNATQKQSDTTNAATTNNTSNDQSKSNSGDSNQSSSSKTDNGNKNSTNNDNDDKNDSTLFATLSSYWLLLYRACIAMGIVHCTTEYFGDITLCEGPSMYPTIYPNGEIIYIDKFFVQTFGNKRNNLESSWIASERIQHAHQLQKLYEQQQRQEQIQQQQQQQKQKQTDDYTYYWYESRISISDIVEHYRTNLTWIERCWVCVQHMISPLSIGDVVVVRHPNRRYGTVCKRIVGLPGDQILMTHYTGRRQQQQRHEFITVPDGHVWLEGDNPANSSDSRNNYGCIPSSLIVGRVLFRLWPLGPTIQQQQQPTNNVQRNMENKNTNKGEDDNNNTSRTVDSKYHIHRTMAWMVRGTRPHESNTSINDDDSGCVVFPAGYNGQKMRTSYSLVNN